MWFPTVPSVIVVVVVDVVFLVSFFFLKKAPSSSSSSSTTVHIKKSALTERLSDRQEDKPSARRPAFPQRPAAVVVLLRSQSRIKRLS